MDSTSYELALKMARSLNHEERLRLVLELSQLNTSESGKLKPTSILDLCGLGADIWHQSDAQEYIRGERSAWAD